MTSDTDLCNGVDDDCDENIDEDEPDRRCMGTVMYGETCVNRCMGGMFEAECISLDGVTMDDCDGTIDDDCDGLVDEDCECEPSMTRPCGCDGTSTCGADRRWGACMDERTPTDETCNDVDDDCDGVTDEMPTDGVLYIDGDMDGFGDMGTTMLSCDPVSGYVDNADDCDDTDGNVNPDGTEVCDTVDQDCDTMVDEGTTNTYYRDADGDGYGSAEMQMEGCTPPAGYVEDDTDCDDDCVLCHPGFPRDICDDGADNDCDGSSDNSCNCGYRTAGGRVYVICLGSWRWGAGRAECQDMGMDYADVEDEAERDALWVFTNPFNQDFWIGGTDAGTEGDWEWVSDGTRFMSDCSDEDSDPCTCETYCYFRSGQPNGRGSQNCLQYNNDTLGIWEDKPCSENKDIICELF